MGNASPHKVKGVVEAIEAKGAYVLWLPTYSPDLNPVEHLWSKIKAYLRKVKARTIDSLYDALKDALDSVSLADIKAWFAMANYSALVENAITCKKTKRYKEQDPEKVAEFEKTIADILAEKIAYVDETGVDTYIHRPYCRAKRGVKVMGSVSGKKYKRTSIVSALIGNKPIEPLQYSGSMDSTLFEA